MTRDKLYEWIFGIICSLAVYFQPVQYFFLTVTFFILSDTILAIMIVVRSEGYHALKSWGLWRVMSKITSAGVFLLVANVVQKQYLTELDCVKIIGIGLIVAELKSIDEKAQDIYGISLYNSIINRLTKKVSKDESGENRSDKAA